MLVLTRKQQQQIQIGDGITVTVLKVKGNTVRIGIDAPSDVKIVRSELELEMEPEEAPAASSEVSRLDQLETPSGGVAISTEQAESSGGYQVLSFRIKPDAQPENRGTSTPRAASMREFLAQRSSGAIL